MANKRFTPPCARKGCTCKTSSWYRRAAITFQSVDPRHLTKPRMTTAGEKEYVNT